MKKNKNNMNKFFIFVLQFVLMVGPLALAQNQPLEATAPIKSWVDIIKYINIAINWLFSLLIILSVLFFILAAFDYLNSAGDKEKLDKAKNRLTYGIIALVVAILAKGIPNLVASFFGLTIQLPGN